ncbi:MAG: division/cell wall cluster transcriptional repressor MraZ [Bacteroidales bacterium]|nr:division/cell wall cluster transcriptional repressor MraZ [Bacteroidales bacterium]
MIKYIGEYKAKVDDKGRLVFPSAFKESENDAQPKFVVKKNLFSDCLEMFPYEEWERESENVRARLNLLRKEDDLFWRHYMRNRCVVTPDGRLGRISIPAEMLESVGIVKEVVFCGKDFKIEIWDREKYDASALSTEEFIALAEKISR